MVSGSSASSLSAVIRNSSPPSMYGTGSASSLACAQRTGTSRRSPPARTISLSAEWWTSEASVGGMRPSGLCELRELLAAAYERPVPILPHRTYRVLRSAPQIHQQRRRVLAVDG